MVWRSLSLKFRLLIGKDSYLYYVGTESFIKGKCDKLVQTWRVDLDLFAAQVMSMLSTSLSTTYMA